MAGACQRVESERSSVRSFVRSFVRLRLSGVPCCPSESLGIDIGESLGVKCMK